MNAIIILLIFLQKQTDIMLGVRGEDIVSVSLEQATKTEKHTPKQYVDLTHMLAN